jgi:hypothetical protein
MKTYGDSRVEAGSNTSTVTLRVLGGDEKWSLESAIYKTNLTSLAVKCCISSCIIYIECVAALLRIPEIIVSYLSPDTDWRFLWRSLDSLDKFQNSLSTKTWPRSAPFISFPIQYSRLSHYPTLYSVRSEVPMSSLSTLNRGWIWGYLSGDSEEYYLLECSDVQAERSSPTFRRKVSPPSSG